MTEERYPKQTIIIRKDLKMRKGKMVAQGSHASMKVFLDVWSVDVDSTETNYILTAPKGSAMQEWLDDSFTKIALSVDSEEELLALYEKAKELRLPCSLVTDNGKTEFHGVKTNTAVAIGPAWPEEIDPLTGHLPLL